MPGTANAADAIRVMVVDDSAVVRGLICRLLEEDDKVKVIVSAANGKLAVEALNKNKLDKNKIDVVVLDIEMPVMDGMTALPKLLEVDPGVKIIMASTLTERNAGISLRALNAGATDYLPKPVTSREITEGGSFRRELLEKVKSLGLLRRNGSAAAVEQTKTRATTSAIHSGQITLRPPGRMKPDIIAIGSSTGGPQALFALLKNLKPEINVPIAITQHMPPTFTAILADHISKMSGWQCSEGKDGDVLRPKHIHLAPGGYHMTVEQAGTKRVLRLDQNPPENFCRPAVDPMFRSISNVFGSRVLAVVLTGMGSDGSKGGAVIAEGGGTVIAQDEKTSVVWGMPGATAMSGVCSAVMPLDDIAPYITKFIAGDIR